MSTETLSPIFVGASDGARLLGISRSGFYKFVKQELLPAPIQLGGRKLWEISKLLAALKQLQSDRVMRERAPTMPLL